MFAPSLIFNLMTTKMPTTYFEKKKVLPKKRTIIYSTNLSILKIFFTFCFRKQFEYFTSFRVCKAKESDKQAFKQ